MKRREAFSVIALGVSAMAGPNLARAQSDVAKYPERPIKIVVQFPPGTTPDNLARLAADHLQTQLRQPVVVDNRPGAAGNIAAEIVAKSTGDGYTLLLGQVGLTWASSLFNKLNYDPNSLKPITVLADAPHVLAARPGLPVSNVRELIAYAKANPGKLTCGTSGIGSPQHLLAVLFMVKTGTKIEPVPYKGSNQIVPDLIAGHIDLLLTSAEGVLPYVPSGAIKVLGTIDKVRLPMLPNVPTLVESGIGIDSPMWVGLFAAPGTPDAIITRLADTLQSMRSNANAVQKITSVGNNVVLGGPEAMKRSFAQDSKLWGDVIRANNIKLD